MSDKNHPVHNKPAEIPPTMNTGTGVLMSTLWNQRGTVSIGTNKTITYNHYCPIDPDTEEKSLTGCTNTAAAQILYYLIGNKGLILDLSLSAEDEYTSPGITIKADGSTPGTISFTQINEMLKNYSLNSAEDAAALIFACGVVQQAAYGSDATSTSWSEELFYRAGLKSANSVYVFNKSAYYWGSMGNISASGFEVLIENLQAGLPVGASIPDHAVVIDGYDAATDSFHVNFGWGKHESTKWYTRAQMQKENFDTFVYDLTPDNKTTSFTVTDPDLYGTGTLLRAFERAQTLRADCTIDFSDSVRGETLALQNTISICGNLVVNDFNMHVKVLDAVSYTWGIGFAIEENAENVCFNRFGGSMIVNTAKTTNAAFYVNNDGIFSLSTDGAMIYAGNYAFGTESAASTVFQTLDSARTSGSAPASSILSAAENSYSIYGSSLQDCITLDNNSIAVGKVNLFSGNDKLILHNGSKVFGNVSLGDGENYVEIDSTSSISGTLYGDMEMLLSLSYAVEDNVMLAAEEAYALAAYSTSITVDISDAVSGTYELISVENAASSGVLKNLSVKIQDDNSTYSLKVSGTHTVKDTKLFLQDNTLQLKLSNRQDTTPPAVPAGFQVTVNGRNAAIDWQDSADNTEIKGYEFRCGNSSSLSGNGTKITESQHNLTSLSYGTYYFQVRAYDVFDNYSSWSSVSSFTIREKRNVNNDIDGNGLSDVMMYHEAGYCGAWLATGDNAVIKWGDLSNLSDGIGILGTGQAFGTLANGQDVFYTDGSYIGAWTTAGGKVNGNRNIANIDASSTDILGLGDFNGDGASDILLMSKTGDVGSFMTNGKGWNYFQSIGSEWDISCIGDFNGDGIDDIAMRHSHAGYTGTWLIQKDGTAAWANLDTLDDSFEIIGSGDFNGDGIDDILVQKGSWAGAWIIEDGSVSSFMGINGDISGTIEQIGDFNGDGIDDLRLRIGNDIGVLYVKGADSVEWQYFGGLGSEWTTTFSAQVC